MKLAFPDFVCRCFTHQRNWHRVAPDGVLSETYQPDPNGVYFAHEDMGVVAFLPMTTTTMQCDIMMLPGAKDTERFAKDALETVRGWGNTYKFAAFIREDNRAALRFVRHLGFEVEGRITKAIMKNGKLLDIIVVGRH